METRMDAARSRSMQPLLQLARLALASALGVLLAMSLLLAVRRFVVGQRPLDAGMAILLAILLAGGAALWRLSWRNIAGMPVRRGLRLAVLLGPTLTLLLLALAVFTTANSSALVLAWLIVAGEEGWMLWNFRSAMRRAAARRSPSLARRDSGESLAANATQSLTYAVEDDGTHVVTGTLRARFQPGERTTAVHIGFCPPLPAAPHIECEQTSGPEAEIRPAQLLAHGARLEVRLGRRNDAGEVVEFDFHASAVCDLVTR